MIRVDWSGPWTKGRPVYAGTIAPGRLGNLNYRSGFLVGWDRWSDDRPTLTLPW